jgi:hypothetical protein
MVVAVEAGVVVKEPVNCLGTSAAAPVTMD